MADEIEEFLRRAAQRRAAQAARQQAAQQQPIRPPAPPPPPRTLVQPQRSALEPVYVDEEPVEVEVIYDTPELGQQVASHVNEALDSRGFSERAQHLGHVVGLADDKMDEHLHQVFDHEVGHLRSRTGPVSSVEPSPSFEEARKGVAGAAPAGAGDVAARAAAVTAGEIAQLLANPKNIRQAIILSEILARPEHRW